MKEINVKGYELVDDGHGGHYIVHERVERFEDDQVRDNDLCTMCQFPAYPECRPRCSVGRVEKWEKEHGITSQA